MQLKITDEVLKGVYANMLQIGHTSEEFILDFMNIFPPAGVVASRIIISPAHMKRILIALTQNIKNFEDQYGQIKETQIKTAPSTTSSSDHNFGFDTKKAV